MNNYNSNFLYKYKIIIVISLLLFCFHPVWADEQGHEEVSGDVFPFEISFYDPAMPPTTAEEWLQVGFAAQMMGDFDEASEALLNATLLKPDSAFYQTAYSTMLFAKGDFESAYHAAKNALDLDPEYADGWSALGDAASMVSDRIDEAIAAYTSSLSLNPESSQAAIIHYNIGSLYLQQGNFKQAREHFEKAIEKDGTNAAYWLNKGVAEFSESDFLSANQSFDRAVALDPSLPGALDNLHVTTEMLKNPPSAPLGLLGIAVGLCTGLWYSRKI